jgi:hypothetical protein
MWFAASSAKSSRTGARSTVALPSAPEVPSESSASNAWAIEPSSKSKPEGGRVECLGSGRREGRLAGTPSPGIDARSAGAAGLLRGAASASAAAPVRFEGGGRAESEGGRERRESGEAIVELDPGAGGRASGEEIVELEGGRATRADGEAVGALEGGAGTALIPCGSVPARSGADAGLPGSGAFTGSAEAFTGSGGGTPREDGGASAFATEDADEGGAGGTGGAPGAGGRTAAMRVESIRTAAISVELSASEYRPGDAGRLLCGASSTSGLSPGARDIELIRIASPGPRSLRHPLTKHIRAVAFVSGRAAALIVRHLASRVPLQVRGTCAGRLQPK